MKFLEITKAASHNLKEVSLKIPLGRFVVFTGVSGSGKSSLAFDTICKEGQRRYLESLSIPSKQILGKIGMSEAESISHIPPTISIEQKTLSHNPRSTVGTISGIYDLLRLLYSKLGEAYCPVSGERVESSTKENIVEKLLVHEAGNKVTILAPYLKQKGALEAELVEIQKKGLLRVRIGGRFIHLEDDRAALDPKKEHSVDLVIDRIAVDPNDKGRLFDSLTTALEFGRNQVIVYQNETGREKLYSLHGYSEKAGIYYPPLQPEDFSFNHPSGWCETCLGLGYTEEFDLDLVCDPNLSIEE